MEIRGIASWCEQIPETSCKNCFKRDGEEESKYCLPRLLSEHDRSDVWIISLWWSNNVYAYPVMWPSCIVWWPRLFSADAPNLKAANKESFPFFNQVNHQLIQITQIGTALTFLSIAEPCQTLFIICDQMWSRMNATWTVSGHVGGCLLYVWGLVTGCRRASEE